MAITVITPSQFVSDTAVVITAATGTSINTSNSMTIVYPQDGALLVKIESSNSATAATLAAGFGVDAQTEVYSVDSGVSSLYVVGSSSKIKSSGGKVVITWATSSAGYLSAFYLPTSNT